MEVIVKGRDRKHDLELPGNLGISNVTYIQRSCECLIYYQVKYLTIKGISFISGSFKGRRNKHF